MKKSNWKVGFLLLGSMCFLASLSSCRENREKTFEKVAKELTKKCPQVINEFTRLDSVVYVPGKNINRYYYTLTGAADNVNVVSAEKMQMKKALVDEVKNSMDMKAYKDFDTTLEYIYYSANNGHELLRIDITPDLYK